MENNYFNFVKKLDALKTDQEKEDFINKTISEIKIEENNFFSEKPLNRFNQLKKKVDYLENIFFQRNILIKSLFEINKKK